MNKHVLLLLAAAILWSLGGVLIKSIDWTPIAIAGSRSLIAIVVIGMVMPDVCRKISRRILPGALAYAGTVVLFVIATKLTSAANAIFLQYTAPVYIAIISPGFSVNEQSPSTGCLFSSRFAAWRCSSSTN